MKTSVRIALIALSVLMLASCKGKKQPAETAAPSISVATPEVKDITLTKDYPGYLSSELTVNLVARVNGYLLPPGGRQQSEEGRTHLRDRARHLSG